MTGAGRQPPRLAGAGWRGALADGLGRLPGRVRDLVPSAQRGDLRHWLGRYHPWESGADLAPPGPRPGETIGPPDFVGIGATMAGCRRWFGMIADHPEVTARPDLPPARHVLSHFAAGSFGTAEIQRYHAWFPRRPGTITGEWTPSYAALPWVASLLARAAPETKVLMIVRNPIDRLRRALEQPPERGSQLGTRIADAVERGCYGRHVSRVLEHFPLEQVLVLQYERCTAEPLEQLSRTYRFLGVDDAHRPPDAGASTRTRQAPAPPLDPGVVSRLVAVYSDDVARLVSLVPTLDISSWPEFSGL